MKTIRLEIELTYSQESAFDSGDKSQLQWFLDILKDDTDLVLHSNEIGDEVGSVRVLTGEEQITAQILA